MPIDPDRAPRNILPDLIIPVVAFGFAVYYLTTITGVPWTAQVSAVFVSCLLFLAIAAYAIRTVLRIRAGSERIALDHLVDELPLQLKRVALLGLTVVYVFLLPRFGFTLTTFLFIFSGILLLSSVANWRRAAWLAASCAIAGYLVFILMFQTRFPKGLIENTLQALMRHGS